MSNFWTDEKVAELTKLHAKGLSMGQIFRLLRAPSRSAVIGKVHRLGLSGPRYTARPKPDRPASRAQRKFIGSVVRTITAREHPPPATPQVPYRDTETPADVEGLVSFEHLAPHHCRWPVGDPKQPDFGFCGKTKVPGLPYCTAHAQRAYRPRGGAPEEPAAGSREDMNRAAQAPPRHRVKAGV